MATKNSIMEIAVTCRHCKKTNIQEIAALMDGSSCRHCQSELDRSFDIKCRVPNKNLGAEAIGRMVDIRQNDALRDGVFRISPEAYEVGAFNDYNDFYSFGKIARSEVTKIEFQRSAITPESQLGGHITGGIFMAIGYGAVQYFRNPDEFEKVLPGCLLLFVLMPILLMFFSSSKASSTLFVFQPAEKTGLAFAVADDAVEATVEKLRASGIQVEEAETVNQASTEAVETMKNDASA